MKKERRQTVAKRRRITRYNDTIGPDFSSGMIVLTIFMAAVVILSVYFACNRESAFGDLDTADTADTLETNDKGEAIDPSETLETEPPEPTFDTVTVESKMQGAGYLILVNNQTEYDFDVEEEIVDLYGNEEKSKSYGLATVNISCAGSILPHLNAFLDDYYAATEDNKVVINSGHRTYENQKSILDDRIASVGEEEAYAYVAIPGFSEHHTGYALDIASYGENNDPSWMPSNCSKYGFIQRYPIGKEEITGIAYEYWHYRYVGVPHAEIMTESGIVMEEYLTIISQNTFEDPYLYTDKNGGSYMIYTVSASETDTTEIKLPREEDRLDYTVSGNNCGGFTVTVKIPAIETEDTAEAE